MTYGYEGNPDDYHRIENSASQPSQGNNDGTTTSSVISTHVLDDPSLSDRSQPLNQHPPGHAYHQHQLSSSSQLLGSVHDSSTNSSTNVSVTAVVHEAPVPNAVPSSLTDSVVPDLMNVYENLKRSSTPHERNQHTQCTTSKYEVSKPQILPDSLSCAVSAGNYNIPAIPSSAYAVMMDGATARAATGTIDECLKEDASSAAGRTLRKRPSKDELSVGSESGASAADVVTGTRRSSKTSKRRKSDKEGDGRWSKRFSWPEDLHRDFVSAIFDVGLKHASPSSILEYMAPNDKLNSERIKSHLQKYRLHRAKSKEAFLNSYDTSLSQLREEKSLTLTSGGEQAAHLTYSCSRSPDAEPPEIHISGAEPPQSRKQLKNSKPKEGTLILPRLTEEEKQSHIGTSMGYLMGLFFTLTQQLTAQRTEQEKAKAAATAVAVVRDPTPASIVTFDTPSVVDSVSSLVPQAAAVPSASQPSTRSNLEENSMMKREMQSQMAFQNKMRALKLEEHKKWRRATGSESMQHAPQHPHPSMHVSQLQSTGHAAHIVTNSNLPISHHAHNHQVHQSQHHFPQYRHQPDSLHDHHLLQTGLEETDFSHQQQQQQLQQQQHHPQHSIHHNQQGVGEMNDADQSGQHQLLTNDRNRSLSFNGNVGDDIWNTDVLDDQLFEFLMEN